MPESERMSCDYREIDKPLIKVPNLSMQFGNINGINAIRYYYKDRVKCIKRGELHPESPFWDRNLTYFDIHSPDHANSFRDDCLRDIVERLFNKKGFYCCTQPYFSEFRNDLLVHKEDFFFIIELKAYLHDVICGEAEIGQAIKYYNTACENSEYKVRFSAIKKQPHRFKNGFFWWTKELDLQTIDKKPKVLLITSGNLRSQEFLDFIKKDSDRKDFDKMVIEHYKMLQDKIMNKDGLDDRLALKIYKTAPQKWRKIYWSHPPKIYQFQYEDIHKWESILCKTDADIILVPSEIFYYILQEEYLGREVRYFDLLQNTSLEELMIDGYL